MHRDPFIQGITNVKHHSSIHPMAYGYLKSWLEAECKRSNNGQISVAALRAKIDFVDAAIALAYDYQNPGRGA